MDREPSNGEEKDCLSSFVVGWALRDLERLELNRLSWIGKELGLYGASFG